MSSLALDVHIHERVGEVGMGRLKICEVGKGYVRWVKGM